jgi:putative membrane-bound dehydrogenase-like protein
MFTRSLLILLAMPLLLSSAEPLTFPSTPPTDSKEAAKTFHVLDGFEMQLIAAEPLVTDPVAITYDEDGRAYVCEMNDYPYTDKSAHKPSQENPTDANIGKVRLLTDTDGDGVFDKASVFAEGLSWPTGAACWKGGIFVTATPDVWYLKDTNGDGVADVRKKVFAGLKKLNVQAVMNNPIWGLDHRIYIAGGTNGGEIRRAEGSEEVMPLPKDAKPLPIKRNDFSFDPSTGDVRLESGGARFGNTFDDWGNRFLCNIRNPCQHVVIPHRYLERNPYVRIPSPLNDCAEAGDQLPVYRTSPVEPWRDFRAQRWSSEGSHLPKSELVGAGVVTSSAGITVYRGDAYPPEYRDFAFVADVAGNLFYRMKLVPDGVTFKAVQVDGPKNFCTSDDVWFRPVNFTNAPDGCLHVCDMYREVIEHPWSIPDDIHAGIDLLKGRDRGRIWRLAPKQPRAEGGERRVSLSKATTPELAALLDHPNGWHRETAQRLLFERQDNAAVEPLKRLVNEAKTPQGKVHALWSLRDHLEQHEKAILAEKVFYNSSQAARGAIGWLLEDALVHSADQQNVFLQSAVLKALGEMKSAEPSLMPLMIALSELSQLAQAEDVLPRLAETTTLDSWLHPILGGLAIKDADSRLIFSLADIRHQSHKIEKDDLIQKLAQVITSKGALQQAQKLANFVVVGDQENRSDWPLVRDSSIQKVALGLAQGSVQRGWTLKDLLIRDDPKGVWNSLIRQAREYVGDSNQDLAQRMSHLPLSLLQGQPQAMQSLQSLFVATEPQELQLAALDALNTYREPAVAEIIVKAWKTFTPALRDKAALVLLSRTDRIPVLLAALESCVIPKTQLSAASRATLARNKSADIPVRVAKLFGDSANSNRKAVIDKYQAALTTKGDATRGAKVYEAACMACHKHGTRGNDVGPHLGTIRAWTPEQLLTNILDPNREVSPNFALYVIETKDGRTLSGLIMSETAGNVVLKRVDGGQESLLRSDIQAISSTGTSLMPEGLEAAISPAQMADLIEFLRE